jgi:Protein of unknown function (DUF3237)
MTPDLASPPLELIARLRVQVSAPTQVCDTPAGQRRIVPITGGEVLGPLLTGRVLPGGADFQLLRTDEGVAELDARYAIELDDGTRIFVVNHAIRRAAPDLAQRLMRGEAVDPALVYFRCAPRFEAPVGPWRWLTSSMFVGTGQRRPDTVELAFFRLG